MITPELAQDFKRIADSCDMWRYNARLLWTSSPARWMAMTGVPLADYLAKLDQLEAVARDVANAVSSQ